MSMNSREIIIKCLPILKSVFYESSEDEDEEFYFKMLMEISESEEVERQSRVCIKNYVEQVVQLYNDKDFKSHFRLTRKTFEVLINHIMTHERNQRRAGGQGRPATNIEKRLLSVLWLLANQESFRSVADRFDLSKSSLHSLLCKMCKTLSEMAPKFIFWPNATEVKDEFESECGFPDVVGAIDGTHIQIKAPSAHPERYYNRKSDYSVVLQAVCQPSLAFTHVFCSYPGSVHDARVLRNSEVHNVMFGNRNYFPNNTHLIGDNGYPLHINLLVPFKDNGHLAPRQLNFNKRLSKTRVCIERAFGQLKGRFRRLKFFDVGRVDKLPLYVLAACVLHNVCVQEGDFVEHEEIPEDDDDEDNSDSVNLTALNKRDYVCGILP